MYEIEEHRWFMFRIFKLENHISWRVPLNFITEIHISTRDFYYECIRAAFGSKRGERGFTLF